MEQSFDLSPELAKQARYEAFMPRLAALIEGIAAEVAQRANTAAALRAAVVAETAADCAEMEGAAVAHIAAKNGAACLVLRAISDNCDEAYDAFCERSFDVDGYARRASEIVLDIVAQLD